MTRPVKAVSEDDIKSIIEGFDVSWLKTHQNDARVLLWNLGIDTDYGIEEQKGLTHRSVLNGITDCTRIVGQERIDREWLKSGHASLEAKEFTNDPTMAQELRKLKNQS